MGELWRSEPMQLVQLFVQVEAAHETVDELGKLALVQFRDLNAEVSGFQRNFVNEVKKCDDMERRLRFFEEQILKEKRVILEEHNQNPEDLHMVHVPETAIDLKKIQLDELETKFEQLEKELLQMNDNQEMLTRNYNELVELQHVLQKDNAFFSDVGEFKQELEEEQDDKGLLPTEAVVKESKSINLGFVSGVIPRSKFASFERVLWRSTRGNLYMKYSEIEEKIRDPQRAELVDKNVFIIFFQGERAQAKITKICSSFGANMYPCPNNGKERKELLTTVNGRLEDLETVLKRSKKHRRQILLDVAKHLKSWKEKVIKEKSIWHTMNMFNYDVGRKCLIGEGWCSKACTDRVISAMRQASDNSGALVPSILSIVQTNEEPPTYFKTNKFTSGFQGIVNSYGIAHYREVNPGALTIITFPFLFAVMFGDLGHGFILTIFAAFLCLNEKKLGDGRLNELIATCFDGRYMLLMMGIFSMYTGWIYNEMFSVAIDFGSNWTIPSASVIAPNETGWANFTYPKFMVQVDPNRTYEFGVDPAWNGAPNTLTYYNSLKMKMSIVLGVTHMVSGICLSAFNGIYFGHYIDVFFEFLPQLFFMLCLFGYLVFLILFKWAAPPSHWAGLFPGGGSPPFLLNTMIQMFLSPANLKKENTLFHGQEIVQPVFLITAIVCVPLMLLVKPLYLKRVNAKKMMMMKMVPSEEEEMAASQGHGHGHGDDEFDFSEVLVKSIIHTIEYVLGTISNTASYLRLWALSLAHSELSQVFWERIFIFLYTQGSSGLGLQFITAFVGFAIWAFVTVCVLLVLESLSAFLHALRLHWVEFQNKFYRGDGVLFIPYDHQRILKGDDE